LRTAVLKSPGDIALEKTRAPSPGAGEALVEVAACGICGSDLHAFRGEHPLVIYPVTPGHEFSGTVTAVGEGVDPGMAGRRVCVEPSLFCGECVQCASGRYNICSELRVMGFQAPGAFSDLAAVPASRLHLLPDGIDLVSGALAEPAAVGVHALRRSGVEPDDMVLIVGGGVIGLMVLKAALADGCDAVMVEGSATRADRALKFGAEEAFVFQETTAEEVAASGGRGFAAVFECVGRAETIDFAVRTAPRGGTVVAVGVPPGPVLVPMPLVQDGELDIRGTLMYRGEDFERAIELIGSGAIKAEDFVTHKVTLDDLAEGYRIMDEAEPRTLKVIVDVGGVTGGS
jgi:L-iditol 2-dehydrogenase